MDKQYFIAVVGFALVMMLGYVVFSLVDELTDRFIYKVKRVSIPISAEDYMKLKKIVKRHGLQKSVEKYLQFHFKEDIKDILESESVYNE